jgi:hypothetical protein
MKIRVLERTQIVPRSLDETFKFLSDPRNLKRLTPPAMQFKFLSNPPKAVQPALRSITRFVYTESRSIGGRESISSSRRIGLSISRRKALTRYGVIATRSGISAGATPR